MNRLFSKTLILNVVLKDNYLFQYDNVLIHLKKSRIRTYISQIISTSIYENVSVHRC